MLRQLLALIVSILLGNGLPGSVELPRLEPVSEPARQVTAAACDRWAAPPGRRLPGKLRNRRRLRRSVPALANALRPGEVGCLLPGTYRHDDPAKLRRPRSTLLGLGPGVRVDGAIWVTGRATRSQVRGLELTASDPDFFIPLKVQADRVLIAENRIRGSRSTSCVLVGSDRRARRVRIERNWIHDCGRRGKLDHLIYLQETRGAIVRGNVLADNPGGWAVHMFPDADGSTIERNLIEGNRGGVIFAGEGARVSDDNLVRWNVIAFSRPRWNIEGSWDESTGSGNFAFGNCLYAPSWIRPGRIGTLDGFDVAENRVVVAPAPGAAARRFPFAGQADCRQLVEPLPAVFPAG